MLLIILQALYFFLPSYVSNAAPVIFAQFKWWENLNVPIDQNRTWRNKPIFGKNKTVRGVLCGTLAGMGIGLLQFLLKDLSFIQPLYLFNYSLTTSLLLGALLGLGEGLGDLIKSFIKRQLALSSGASAFPLDQLSFVGAYILGLLIYTPSLMHTLCIFIFSLGIPMIANLIAYKIGWKKVWW